MALTSKTRSAPVIDLSTLTHLHQHPELVPLFGRRAEIRERLHDLEKRLREQRHLLHEAQNDNTPSGMGRRREAEDTLANLEREVVTLEAELHDVQGELETTKDMVKGQLTPRVAQEGTEPVAELLAALERLADAGGRYTNFVQWSHRVLDSSLAPHLPLLRALPATIIGVQQLLAKLDHQSMT
jgi:hypothetical protein